MASPVRCEHPIPRQRLLILASTFPGRPDDGTPAFVHDLARRQAEHFDVSVVVPAVPGAATDERDGRLWIHRFRFFFRRFEDVAAGAILDNLRARPTRWLQVVPFLVAEVVATRRAVRSFRPDVIHAHWLIPQGLVATIAAPRTPLLVTTLGGDLYALRGRLMRSLKRKVVRRAAAVTVMNDDMKLKVVALGAEPNLVFVLPMGADLSTFSADGRPSPGETLRLLSVGRLVEKKGLPVLASALRGRRLTLPWSLTVVGDGPLRAELEAQFADLDATFLGQQGRTDLARAYRLADIAVFPFVTATSGDQDGLPVALLEAMGSGCAVIVSDIPGPRELIVDGVSGVLVPPGDVEALAAAVARLGADPELRARLGRNAVAAVRSSDVVAVGERYADLLHAIIDRRAPATR